MDGQWNCELEVLNVGVFSADMTRKSGDSNVRIFSADMTRKSGDTNSWYMCPSAPEVKPPGAWCPRESPHISLQCLPE
ncbi:hypothetical protein N7495_007375 [Penicillium taxi]|uniref:uncharacterized protein n=1 Tax=Penicillium taxi TaxID=168475 RepID=UPI0025457947|nr:uncharacterized protein N7495_007375 [Penicillium taxi]KAJ5895684.1 hypothetical protein N7495_007375 [Penicillium taxi]